MTQLEKMMSILEGWCPEDEGRLEIIYLGGYEDWLRDSNPYDTDDIEVQVWERPDPNLSPALARESHTMMNQGAVEFKCPVCRRTYWVEATPHGDWVM